MSTVKGAVAILLLCTYGDAFAAEPAANQFLSTLTKPAAISTFTKGWSKELAPHGIRVNAVSPGTVDNYFHEKHSNRQILDNMLAVTPFGRLGTNEDVSDVIVFLCSDASRYVHGQTIEINGGMLMV